MAKGIKASELREKSGEELAELAKGAQNKLFEARFQNYTNRLTDTSQIRKLRREIARIRTITAQKKTVVASSATSTATESKG